MTARALRRHVVRGAGALCVALSVAVPAAADVGPGRVGPAFGITVHGRKLDPIGRQTRLGNFSGGGALTPDGHFYWAVDAGNGRNDVKVVDVTSGRVAQTLPLPGGSGGIAFAPNGKRAYVSGTQRGGPKPEGPVKGEGGDVIHVFDVSLTGHAVERGPIALPAVSGGSGQMNALPPVSGDYPQELAVSPNGKTLVVAMTLADSAALVDLGSGAVRTVHVGAYPFGAAFGGNDVAYVSNQYDGTVSVIDVATGQVTSAIGVGGAGGDRNAHPQGMVVDAAHNRLYVAVASRDEIAVIDTRGRRLLRSVSVGRHEGVGTEPTALALAPDAQTLYAADSNEDAIVAVSLTDRPLTEPRSRTVVRVRSTSSIATYLRRHRRALEKLRAAGRSAAARRAYRRTERRLRRTYLFGTQTTACGGPTRGRERAYTDAVIRALAISNRRARNRALAAARGLLPRFVACPGYIPGLKAFSLIGRVPTAWYPTGVAVTPNGRTLVWLSGLGLGSGPNSGYQFYGDSPYGTHLQDTFIGIAGMLPRPTDKEVRSLAARADAGVRPSNATAQPPNTPLRGGGPIKHVFYIVKENRVYDQIFGSDPRGDGDPKLELFDDNGAAGDTGGVTPNAHALTRRFPLLDHVYSDSQVSADGHVITASAYANDYVIRSVQARGRGLDQGVFPISFPPNDFVFDQAVRQGVSLRIYGENGGGNSPFANDGRPTFPAVLGAQVPGYPTNVQIDCLGGTPAPGTGIVTCARDAGVLGGTNGTADPTTPAVSRFQVFQADFEGLLAAGNVPTFNYLILPNDHTNGTRTNARTPKALVADNDLGLGQIVQEISQSPIWAESAIIVIEDDSQDGADHVDAHRQPAYVISPYARRGVVVHTRYDQYSALRTAEILAGLRPLGLNDALATPMYDAFVSGSQQPDVEGTRYTAIQPHQPLGEVNTRSAPDARLSAAMPFERLDMVPQSILDGILWHSVHGAGSTPPRPGPGASPAEHARAVGAMRAYRARADVRRYLSRQGDANG